MSEKLMRKHTELHEDTKKYDEVLMAMINDRTRDVILNILKDYLLQI